MCDYALNVEMELYGPYYSEKVARFAQYLFASKYPELAVRCRLLEIDPDDQPIALLDPRLLN